MLPAANPAVIYRALPDGAVLFSTADEVYFGLNRVAARVWELLPPVSRSFDDLCATLSAEYPDVEADELRADVRALLRELAEFGLVGGGGVETPVAAETASAHR